MKQTISDRALVRKRAFHATKANIAHKIFNTKKTLVISCNGVQLRITPRHTYYTAVKALLNDIGADHVGKRIFADLAIDGDPIDPAILNSL